MAAVPLRRNRDFVLLQAGQFLSSAGSQATAIAYPLLVLALTHSAVKAGLVSFARTAPIAVLAIPAGLAADHWNRRALMIGADVLRAAAMAGLAIGLVVGDVPFWVITCVAFVEGIGAPSSTRRSRARCAPSCRPNSCPRQPARRVAGPRPCGSSVRRWAARSSRPGVPSPSWSMPAPTPARRSPCSSCGRSSRRSESWNRARCAGVHSRASGSPGINRSCAPPPSCTACLNFTALGLLFCIVVIGESEGLPGGEIGLLTGVFAASVVVGSFVSRVVRREPLRPCRAHPRGLGLVGLRGLPRLAPRRRLGARAGPGRTGGALDGLGRERLPHRRHAGSPARPRRVRSQCDRPVRRLAGTAGRRVPPAALDAPLDGGILHRLGLGLALWATASGPLRAPPPPVPRRPPRDAPRSPVPVAARRYQAGPIVSACHAAPPLLRHAADVTPEWLTDALRRAGALGRRAPRCRSFETAPIGTGQMADTTRFTLTLDERRRRSGQRRGQVRLGRRPEPGHRPGPAGLRDRGPLLPRGRRPRRRPACRRPTWRRSSPRPDGSRS